MSRTNRSEASDHRHSKEIEIAHQVKRLVSDHLIRSTQPLGIQHAPPAEHDRVGQRAAERLAGSTKSFHIRFESERASPADVGLETIGGGADDQRLTADSWMWKVDTYIEREFIGRLEAGR